MTTGLPIAPASAVAAAQALWNTREQLPSYPCCFPPAISQLAEAGTTLSEIATNQCRPHRQDRDSKWRSRKSIGAKAFTIEGDRLFNDPEVLVVNATGSPIIEDTLVQVTGTVRKFVVSKSRVQFEPGSEFEVEFRTSL